MNQIRNRCATIALFIVGLSGLALAGENRVAEIAAPAAATTKLTDLTLGNFFSAGWDENFTRRPRPDGAPDLSLLRVQTNFLVRGLRTDYYYQHPLESSRDHDVQYLNELVEWGLNRRLMLAIFGTYQSADRRYAENRDGSTWGALARFQLVDTLRGSYALNLKVTAPNDGLDEKLTNLSFALAGWHDLTPLGLKRVGLYWHVQEETFIGPHNRGAKQNDLTYDVSLAKTWSSPDAAVANFTTFLETYAKTDLDGPRQQRSVVTLTPGLRFNVAHRNIFMFGVDFAVSEPRPFQQTFRASYLFSF